MLLTITCTRAAGADWVATDLGFLLHKNPGRVQVFEQSYGRAHVLYPEAAEQRCTAALLLEIDPIRLVRGKSRGTPEFSLGQYVNDRPYAASSLLAVAIATVFGTALHGRCAQRPDLAATALPLRLELPAVPCQGGPELAERMFAPLGWRVRATPIPLDPAFPEWGESHYLRLELAATIRVAEALSHLYVLLPALDGAKHYWLAPDEIDKLLRAGEGWLPTHPERTWITHRYLSRRRSLIRAALARLAEIDETDPEQLGAVENVDSAAGATEVTAPQNGPLADTDPAAMGARAAEAECGAGESSAAAGERGPSLAVARRQAVLNALREVGARRVLDLGCGEGALIRELLADKRFAEIVGVDVSMRALHIAQRRLGLDRLPPRVAERVTLRQGALTYTDAALRGYDAAVLMEVIEHVDPPRLAALAHAVFGSAAPGAVIVTTPNGEYNVSYEGLRGGRFRHADHRFEWSRAEFAAWAHGVAERYGYAVRFDPIGPEDAPLGAPTQMAVFQRSSTSDDTATAFGGEVGA
ncbi:3' terminal RNA ribose 2'-O-methyltransferase Hen1 [Nocardia terpenica]|uniref:3' terminal RNA ribose 2'-O-methyltransferase Hen1 n=1 Tax=Nocardia terpenica TaxID=455432 RepID=UPI001894B22F|nr:3' terminal RNA ribose 2'-O-methyltransferase Hen1 [Nocardia terpenica]MBF6064886.1 3' terminal RNA ribose 2'-O-methyltransferase Hen1 [Nocardia terpenica]MBF6107401.1 3' terminal RNA ribose 2'-O-methyltransferase Hen1 [Nocardia terpenica]MBF6115158.1 3' terminal RNA ribose 2'-O-methyltransferase Hen1 [Nocardia terpenica]MBF6122264.1 3' terminal RNA ribose 2'-O-methyltransferase Hen1 [Nocardia terpenica]MBF6154647.1 3' terminal RNA ribose 2'-O-methyltransferase Hen1 [Nocardia terpenica]